MGNLFTRGVYEIKYGLERGKNKIHQISYKSCTDYKQLFKIFYTVQFKEDVEWERSRIPKFFTYNIMILCLTTYDFIILNDDEEIICAVTANLNGIDCDGESIAAEFSHSCDGTPLNNDDTTVKKFENILNEIIYKPHGSGAKIAKTHFIDSTKGSLSSP